MNFASFSVIATPVLCAVVYFLYMGARRRYFSLVILAIAIPLIGYVFMHLLVYFFPMRQDSDMAYFIYTVVIIALGLLVPYFMLKIGMKASHLRDPHEKELTLSDIPKDKEELAHDPENS